MELLLKDNLPFISLTVAFQGQTTKIESVLVDTGSATTILGADAVARVQIFPSPEDELHTIRGVGGSEAVFNRVVDYLKIEF